MPKKMGGCVWGSTTTWIFSLQKVTFFGGQGCVKGPLIELSKVGGDGFPAATMANSLQLLARWKLLTFNYVDGGGCDYRVGESDDDCEGAEKEVGGHGTMGQQFKPVQQYRFRQ